MGVALVEVKEPRIARLTAIRAARIFCAVSTFCMGLLWIHSVKAV